MYLGVVDCWHVPWRCGLLVCTLAVWTVDMYLGGVDCWYIPWRCGLLVYTLAVWTVGMYFGGVDYAVFKLVALLVPWIRLCQSCFTGRSDVVDFNRIRVNACGTT